MEEQNFEIGNEEKGVFSVEFGENGNSPSFLKDGETVEDAISWTRGILPLFGYNESIEEVEVKEDKERGEILLTGEFGSLSIKKNGGLEFERKSQGQNSPKVPA